MPPTSVSRRNSYWPVITCFAALATRDPTPTRTPVGIRITKCVACRQASSTRRAANPLACMPACTCADSRAGDPTKGHGQPLKLPCVHIVSRHRIARSRSVAWLAVAGRTSPLACTALSRCQRARHNPPLTSLAPSALITYAIHPTPLFSQLQAVQGLIRLC